MSLKKMTCKLLFRGNGQKIPGFVIGCQLCVETCFYIVARVTTVSMGDDPNIFGFPDWLQEFKKYIY